MKGLRTGRNWPPRRVRHRAPPAKRLGDRSAALLEVRTPVKTAVASNLEPATDFNSKSPWIATVSVRPRAALHTFYIDGCNEPEAGMRDTEPLLPLSAKAGYIQFERTYAQGPTPQAAKGGTVIMSGYCHPAIESLT